MGNYFFKAILIYLLLGSCKVNDKFLGGTAEDNIMKSDSTPANSLNEEFSTYECGGYSHRMDTTFASRSIYGSNTSHVRKCLVLSAFNGDKRSVDVLYDFLQDEKKLTGKVTFVSNDRFRGARIFKFFLDISEDYNCKNKEYEQTYFGYYFVRLVEMIDNVNGVGVREAFIQNYVSTEGHIADLTVEERLALEGHHICGFIEYQKKWHYFLASSFRDGRLVLKDFGEE